MKMAYKAICAVGVPFFFAIFFLYLWLIVDCKLFFHGGGTITNYPVFFKGLDFFLPFMSRPGGLSEYVAAFFSQALFYSPLGAAVLTAVTAGICFAIQYIIKQCDVKSMGWIWFLPMILLAAIYGRYSFNFVTTVTLLISLTFTGLYLTTKARTIAGRLLIFTALLIPAYLITGGAFWVFAVSSMLYDILFTKDKSLVIVQLFVSVLIPYLIGFLLVAQIMIDAYTSLLPFSWKIIVHEDARATAWLMYSIYLIAPIVILAAGISKLKPNILLVKFMTKLTSLESSWAWLRIFIIVTIILSISFDRKTKLLFQADYYSYYQQWNKTIDIAKKDLNSLVLCSTATRALYHQHQLFDKMFELYQFPTILFMQTQNKSKLFWKRADIFLDLGHFNLSEHLWTRSLDAFGERPMVLKRLAWINLVKDNKNAAIIYLNSIKRTFFFNDFADKYLELLNTDPQLTTDAEIQLCRKKMLQNDYCRDFSTSEIAVSNLLQSCKDNQMAYEYMLSWFLLTKQLDKLTQNMKFLTFFGYDKLPQCLEDAVLIYQSKTRQKVALSLPMKITPQGQQRYADFSRICSAYQVNEAQLINQLSAEYGNSYLFYFLFSRSGMKNEKVN